MPTITIDQLNSPNGFRSWYNKNKNPNPGLPVNDNWWKRKEQEYGTEFQASEINPTVKNRFEGYESPYSYGDQKSFLDEIYGQYEDEINQQAGEATADLTQDATQRMLSRGIQGGSVVEDTLSGIGSEVNKNKLNVLGNLKAKKAQSNLGLMDTANTRDFATTQGAQSVDLQNFMNQMQKLGLLSDINFKNEYLQMQKDAQPGFLEDLFSGIGDLASLVPGLGQLGLFNKKKSGGIAPIDV